MIVQALFNLIFGLINFILGLLPSLPNFNESSLSDFNQTLDIIFDNAGLLGFFFPISTIKVYIPLVLLAINFEHIYKISIWVISWFKSHK